MSNDSHQHELMTTGLDPLVDFGKLLGKAKITKPVDPIEIFNNLDKESGKEYIRDPQQKTVLEEWYQKRRNQKDIIVKMPTGHGKTLIGLLILQSCLNDAKGPAMYVCPNNYLVNQTVEQARSFGIKTIQFTDSKPPQAFLNSDAILVTNCSKLFNGKSVFGVIGSRREVVNVGAIVVDDAHKCLDIIRESFSVRAARLSPEKEPNPIYENLWRLFEDTLRRQAAGSCEDIHDGKDCQMAVPFWSWMDKQDEVLAVLSEHKESKELLFVWDLIKNHLPESVCIFSGGMLEITPRLLPADLIPSFSEAKRRIFLSATLNEDAFLVRDLGIDPDSVMNPLTSKEVKYSGERLILIPTLVDTEISRGRAISWLRGLAARHGSFGVVAITPSFKQAKNWKEIGGFVTKVDNLYSNIELLKENVKGGTAKQVLVLVNEYDGVDLPDSTCRILALDSLPRYSTLMDNYLQEMRPNSGITRRRLAQRVEQGMGRAIRGPSDWCMVVIVGNNISDFLSESSKRAFLSNEAQLQIRIGEDLAAEMKDEGGGMGALEKLINQCLRRDAQWKEYYKSRMSELEPDKPNKERLDLAISERKAEMLYRQSRIEKSAEVAQAIVDSVEPVDRGWFLQLKASYYYSIDRTKSMDIQLKAHTENFRLFRPEAGVSYSRLTSTGDRVSRIIDWVKKHESHTALTLDLASILDSLSFGSPSDSFEGGMDELGKSLGLLTQRPEKTTGKGPDNLWHIQGSTYWLIECKNEVSIQREEISKKETGQLNNSIGWFKENYEEGKAIPILIHPADTLARDAYLNETAWSVNEERLKKLKEYTKNFYYSLKELQFDSVTNDDIKRKLKEHKLDTDELSKEYLKRVEQIRNKKSI